MFICRCLHSATYGNWRLINISFILWEVMDRLQSLRGWGFHSIACYGGSLFTQSFGFFLCTDTHGVITRLTRFSFVWRHEETCPSNDTYQKVKSKPSGLWTKLSFTMLWPFLSFTVSFIMLNCDLLSFIIPWLWLFGVHNSLRKVIMSFITVNCDLFVIHNPFQLHE